MSETNSETLARWRNEDRLMRERKASGKWPAFECDSCRRVLSCCQRHHHHVGECCTHCGNDERHLRGVR